jgi:SAM-dependent methyltransferase
MKRYAEIFIDIEAHIESGRFIGNTSTNRNDIRDFTFHDVDLGSCRNILDLGCSYGYFTRGLAGRLHPEAHLVGVDLWEGCAKHFIHACRESGYSGEFVLSGKELCKRFPNKCFDLVLCSYSLYFFPYAIPDIVRILRPDGFFITVTHNVPHMPELVNIVKILLEKRQGYPVRSLPLEELSAGFSSANGLQMLSSWFLVIKEKKYVNSLKITHESLPALINYLCFKRPKFIPHDMKLDEQFIRSDVADHFRDLLTKHDSVTITKDDTAFICRYPQTNN